MNATGFRLNCCSPAGSRSTLCQDKYALNVFLRRRGIPAPQTYPVRSLRDLDRIFARFSRAGILWCRARRGSRALAATPVATVEQARVWITQWRDLRGIAGLQLHPGGVFAGTSFHSPQRMAQWFLAARPASRGPGLFCGGKQPERRIFLVVLGENSRGGRGSASEPDRGAGARERPSGAFSVELKESVEGVPSITEINAGRFPAGVTALLAVGNDNMVAVFASAALGQTIAVADPHGSPLEYYLVRDIDAVPGVFPATDVLEGICRIDIRADRRKAT